MVNAPSLESNGTDGSSSQSKRILVVDDEDIIRVLLTEILTEEGYEVITAPDGEHAVELLEKENFDLVISDMVMPGMNGIEVLQADMVMFRIINPRLPGSYDNRLSLRGYRGEASEPGRRGLYYQAV